MSEQSIITDNDRDAGVVEEISGYLTEIPPRSSFFSLEQVLGRRELS